MNLRPVEQPVEVGGRTTVPTHQPVVPEDDNFAALRDRCVRRLRHHVGVGQPVLDAHALGDELGEFLFVESQQVHVETASPEFSQFDGQDGQIPLGQFAGFVVGDAIGPDLLGRQVGGHMHRHFVQAELLRRLPPRVAGDDHAVGIDDDGRAEAELLQAGRHGVHRLVVQPGIPVVRPNLVDAPKYHVKRLGHHA